MEILKDLQNGQKNIEAIKTQLFDVIKTPYKTGIKKYPNPNNAFGVYKKNGGEDAWLGNVGKDFTPTQPKLLFEDFESCLYDTDAKMQDVKYMELKGGSKIVFEAPIKTIGFKNLKGEQDEMIVKINLATGFDGLTKTSLFISCYRMVCANGMKAWRTEFAASFKNTKNNIGKASSLCYDVAKATDQINDFEAYLRKLDKVQVNQAKVDEFLLKTLEYNQSMYSELHGSKKAILDNVQESIALEFSRTGSTLWGLVNGITHYTNHVAKADDRNDYLLVGAGLKLNDKAQKVALEMAY
jgi:hypothetical protein